mgnify:CR=1 FL=1
MGGIVISKAPTVFFRLTAQYHHHSSSPRVRGCAAPASSNDIRMTNVPNIRLCYRDETLRAELKFINDTGTA